MSGGVELTCFRCGGALQSGHALAVMHRLCCNASAGAGPPSAPGRQLGKVHLWGEAGLCMKPGCLASLRIAESFLPCPVTFTGGFKGPSVEKDPSPELRAPDWSTPGRRCRWARTFNGLALGAAARALGTTPVDLSAYEIGDIVNRTAPPPTPDVLLDAMGKLYGVNTAFLASGQVADFDAATLAALLAIREMDPRHAWEVYLVLAVGRNNQGAEDVEETRWY